jgi:hypothetical protein
VDLHGLAPWLDRVSVNGAEVQRGAGDSWFANVALDANSATHVTIRMGETTTERQIDWEPTVVSNVDGQTMTLRVGDRLNIRAVQDPASVSSMTLLKNGSVVSEGSILFAEAGQDLIRA